MSLATCWCAGRISCCKVCRPSSSSRYRGNSTSLGFCCWQLSADALGTCLTLLLRIVIAVRALILPAPACHISLVRQVLRRTFSRSLLPTSSPDVEEISRRDAASPRTKSSTPGLNRPPRPPLPRLSPSLSRPPPPPTRRRGELNLEQRDVTYERDAANKSSLCHRIGDKFRYLLPGGVARLTRRRRASCKYIFNSVILPPLSLPSLSSLFFTTEPRVSLANKLRRYIGRVHRPVRENIESSTFRPLDSNSLRSAGVREREAGWWTIEPSRLIDRASWRITSRAFS